MISDYEKLRFPETSKDVPQEFRERFEKALDVAWLIYNDSGARLVDGCEDNYVELAFCKGFLQGCIYENKRKEEQIIKEDEEEKHIMLSDLEYC